VSAVGGFAGGARSGGQAGWVPQRLPGLGSRDGIAAANAINNHGQIVGFAYVDDTYHAVLWQNGKPRDLGTLGGRYSSAEDINDRGQIVGWSLTKGDDFRSQHAFLWEDGKMRDLGTIPGPHPDSEATAINERGQIVGRTNSQSGRSRAWLWQGGKMHDLGVLAGNDSGASAINEHGQVVGWSTAGVFLYEKGRLRSLGIESGYGGVLINDNGVIVTSRTNLVWRAGRVTRLCGSRVCNAGAINNRSQIVGNVAVSEEVYSPALFANGRISRLATPGWRDGYASDINERNQIVGDSYGDHPDEYVAWLWTKRG
jgi:probable HAF family extracellular repeat protein